MRIFAVALCLLLSACVIGSPKDIGNAHRVELAPLTVKSAHRGGSLVVAYPVAAEWLDTYRIAYEASDGKQQYYRAMRWDEFLPAMLQKSVRESFTRSGIYTRVGMDDRSFVASERLQLEIQRFAADYSKNGSAPTWRIEMRANFLDANSLRARRSIQVKASVKAEADTRAAVLAAAQQAFEESVRQLLKAAPNS